MQKTIGSTLIAKISSQEEMNQFVASLGLTSDTVIVKPNWVMPTPGAYSDAQGLDWFLTAINRPTIIVESYTFWRTDKYVVGGGDYFSSEEATLETGKKHADHFKKMDKWFLEATGIGEILKKHGAKYLNITEEVWLGRTVSPEQVKTRVEEKFAPVALPELYSYIPKELFDLKGADFISFSKAKRKKEYGFTLSTKNLFGLIPNPTRWPKYHGESEEILARSIADINKIYRSLFNCTFVIDGLFTAGYVKSMKEILCVKDWRMILGGKNSIEVDMLGAGLLEADFKSASVDTLQVSKELFGDFDQNLLKELPEELKIKYF